MKQDKTNKMFADMIKDLLDPDKIDECKRKEEIKSRLSEKIKDVGF